MKYHLLLNNSSIQILLLIPFVLLLQGCGEKESQNNKENQPKGRSLQYTSEVTFLDQTGEFIITIDVSVADNDAERSAGLMDVNKLPSDKGMLFIFEDEQPRSFWMANTPLSLDIIFVNADMEIVRIHQNTQPFAEKNFTSGEPAKYVVEVNGGFCISHDIREGMKVKL